MEEKCRENIREGGGKAQRGNNERWDKDREKVREMKDKGRGRKG